MKLTYNVINTLCGKANLDMKIAILTLYYKSSNYGGILQSYALQHTLQLQGHDCKQISYILDSGYKGYKKKKIWNKTKLIIKKLIRQKWYLKHVEHAENLFKFAEAIPHTKELKADQLSTICEDFDVFIVGSDQVWNPIGWQSTMFFDFLPEGKFCFSYAASIARSNLNEEEIKFIKNHIQRFRYVSVREKQSADMLNNANVGKDVVVMPDPTFLLDKENWDSLSAPILVKEKYVFAYFLGLNFKQREDAISFAKKKGLKVFFIPYMDKRSFEWDKAHEKYMLNNVGVPEFLSIIKNASYVITDSFHGAVFSSIFKTPFVVLDRFASNDKDSMNSRIDTLMKNLNIQRGFSSLDVNRDYNFTETELRNIDEALANQRTKGISFLTKALEG